MSQMNLMYYCEKVRLDFADHEPNLQQLEKLMKSCEYESGDDEEEKTGERAEENKE